MTTKITEANISDNAVTESKLATGAVTSGKIGSSAVTEAKIASSAVTSGKIGSGAVTEAKIASDAVTNAKIGAGAITSTELGSGAALANIGSGNITSTYLGTSSVTSDKINAGAVSTAKLEDASITSTKIADGSILNVDINSSAAIAASKITGIDGQLTSIKDNIAVLGFKMAVNDGLTVYNLVDGIVDEFEDTSGITASASGSYQAGSDRYRSGIVGSATVVTFYADSVNSTAPQPAVYTTTASGSN